MKVINILHAKGQRIATIRPDAAIGTAVRRLRLEGIGALVVSEDGEHVLGIVSERDVVRALADHGNQLTSMHVMDIMTRSVKTCRPDDSIKHVMAEMTRSRIRHLPVMEHGAMCGIISIGDVVKNRLEEIELEASVLRDAYIASH
jgi:CBS domain-containing protein